MYSIFERCFSVIIGFHRAKFARATFNRIRSFPFFICTLCISLQFVSFRSNKQALTHTYTLQNCILFVIINKLMILNYNLVHVHIILRSFFVAAYILRFSRSALVLIFLRCYNYLNAQSKKKMKLRTTSGFLFVVLNKRYIYAYVISVETRTNHIRAFTKTHTLVKYACTHAHTPSRITTAFNDLRFVFLK